MRTIAYNQILQTVEHLCIASAYDLPADVLAAIRTAAQTEPDPRARRILDQLIENARIAARDRIPICQDTGLAVVFIDQGADVVVAHPDNRPDATLYDAVNEGVAAGYEKGLLRKSVVAEPLHERPNTQTNTPAVIHHRIVPGDRLHITIMSKGGGCENKSQFKMFNPTESADAVCNWIADVVTQAGASACPPFVVGVGLGGNFELACLSANVPPPPVAEPHPDPFYADSRTPPPRMDQRLQPRPPGPRRPDHRTRRKNRNRPLPHRLTPRRREHRMPRPPPQIRNTLTPPRRLQTPN